MVLRPGRNAVAFAANNRGVSSNSAPPSARLWAKKAWFFEIWKRKCRVESQKPLKGGIKPENTQITKRTPQLTTHFAGTYADEARKVAGFLWREK
jgi:hypothetical protein